MTANASTVDHESFIKRFDPRDGLATLKSLDHRTRTFAQQHPIAAVAAATILGYVIGRVSSR